MNLSDLSAIGSFVSAIAVVVTLIFLLLQMRQANLNQRSLMQQGRSANIVNMLLAQSEPFQSEAIILAEQALPTMTAVQIQSYVRLVGAWMWGIEDSFHQYRAGTLTAAAWETDLASLRSMLAMPSIRVAWRFVRIYSTGEYRNFVDDTMRQTKVAQPAEWKTQWTTMLSEEMAAIA
jgi:hypothetical protein